MHPEHETSFFSCETLISETLKENSSSFYKGSRALALTMRIRLRFHWYSASSVSFVNHYSFKGPAFRIAVTERIPWSIHKTELLCIHGTNLFTRMKDTVRWISYLPNIHETGSSECYHINEQIPPTDLSKFLIYLSTFVYLHPGFLYSHCRLIFLFSGMHICTLNFLFASRLCLFTSKICSFGNSVSIAKISYRSSIKYYSLLHFSYRMLESDDTWTNS